MRRLSKLAGALLVFAPACRGDGGTTSTVDTLSSDEVSDAAGDEKGQGRAPTGKLDRETEHGEDSTAYHAADSYGDDAPETDLVLTFHRHRINNAFSHKCIAAF